MWLAGRISAVSFPQQTVIHGYGLAIAVKIAGRTYPCGRRHTCRLQHDKQGLQIAFTEGFNEVLCLRKQDR